MATVGGDVLTIAFKHPTLGSATINIKAGETSNFDDGGPRTADDKNGIDGSGQPIWNMSQQRWEVSVTARNNMNGDKEMEYLSALSGDTEDSEVVITHINGIVYGGTGRPVGDIIADGKAATIPLKLQGGGKLSQV